MKKFNLSKGLVIGLLTLALVLTGFATVKASAEDAKTATIKVTVALNDGGKTTNYTATYTKEAEGEVTLETILADVKAGGKTIAENGKTVQKATSNFCTGENVVTDAVAENKLLFKDDKFTVGSLTANQTFNVTLKYDAVYTGTAALTVTVKFAEASANDGTNLTYTYTVPANNSTTEDVTVKYADIIAGAKRTVKVDGEDVVKTIADDFPDGVTIYSFGPVKNGTTEYYAKDATTATSANSEDAGKMITSVSGKNAENASIVLKKQTNVTALGALTAELEVRRNKIYAVYTATVNSKSYIAKIKVDYLGQYRAVDVKASDIVNAFVTNDKDATPLSEVGAYVITACGADARVTDYNYTHKVKFEDTHVTNKTYAVTLAEAITGANYSPEEDVIYFTSTVANTPIYWADVKKSAGAKLKPSAFKTLTTNELKFADLVLNDKGKGLKVGENKAVYIYYTGIKPDAKSAEYTPNFTLEPTNYKKITIVPNYAIADPSVMYDNLSDIAVASITLVDNAKTTTEIVAGSTDADMAKSYEESVGKIQYSKDQKTWYTLTDGGCIFDGYSAETSANITVDASSIKYNLVNNLFFKWTGSGVDDPEANYKLAADGTYAALASLYDYTIEDASSGLSVAMNEAFVGNYEKIKSDYTNGPFADAASSVVEKTFTYKKGWYKQSATEPTDFSSVITVEGYYGGAIAEGSTITLSYSEGLSGGATPGDGSRILVTWKEGASVTQELAGTYTYHEGWFVGANRVNDENVGIADWFTISGQVAGSSFKVKRAALQTAEDFGIKIEVVGKDENGDDITALTSEDNFCIDQVVKSSTSFDGSFLYANSRAKSTIYFRYLGSEAKTGANAENAVRNSKVVKVSIKAAAKKKEVKLDVAADALALKNGYDFAVSDSKTEVPTLSAWKTVLPFNKNGKVTTVVDSIINTSAYIPAKKINEENGNMFTTAKFKSVSIATIIDGFENLDSTVTKYIWVRKSASTTAPAQEAACIEIKARTAAPTLTEANLTKLKVASAYTGKHYAIGDEKNVMLLPAIKNASADKNAAAYEFLVVNAADDGKVDFSSAKWTKAASGTKITAEKSKSKYKLTTDTADTKASDHTLQDGDYIYLRRAGVKGKVVASQIIKLQVKKVKITPSDTTKEAYEAYCLVQ